MLHAKGGSQLPIMVPNGPPLPGPHRIFKDLCAFSGLSLLEIPNLSPPAARTLEGPSVRPAQALPNTSLSLGTSQLES